MFGRKVTEHDAQMAAIIQRICAELVENGPDSEEYATNLAYLERLKALQPKPVREAVSPNTVITAVAYFGGVMAVIIYEQKHAWVTKALSVMPKMTK